MHGFLKSAASPEMLSSVQSYSHPGSAHAADLQLKHCAFCLAEKRCHLLGAEREPHLKVQDQHCLHQSAETQLPPAKDQAVALLAVGSTLVVELLE